MGLTESASGDLHSNATITLKVIQLSTSLLKHHKGQDEEIIAILCHEIGHHKKKHIPKLLVFNTFYMLIFGALLIPLVEREDFLASFNIHMNSYLMLLLFYALLY